MPIAPSLQMTGTRCPPQAVSNRLDSDQTSSNESLDTVGIRVSGTVSEGYGRSPSHKALDDDPNQEGHKLLTLHKMPKKVATACLLLLTPGLLIAWGGRDPDEELSRAEVERIVHVSIPNTPAPADPGLSHDEVERIVQSAVADIPTPEPGLTLANVRQVVQAAIAGIPEPEPGVTRDDAVEMSEKSVRETPLNDLTAPDVNKIVRVRIAELPQPESSLTRADIDEVVRANIAGIPQPVTGLTHEEVAVVMNETIVEILGQVLPSEPSLTREEVLRIACPRGGRCCQNLIPSRIRLGTFLLNN